MKKSKIEKIKQKETRIKEIKPDFFNRDTVAVAKDLVGKILRIGNINARILEVEAYKEDAASHARTRTKRSSIMFDTYGHVYVYFIYGMYHCLNFTTDSKPGAVLIRALDYPGCEGPGKLCRTLGITLAQSGERVGKTIRIFDDGLKPKILASKRIGISRDSDLLWRFTKKKINAE